MVTRPLSTTPDDVFKAKAAGIPAYKLYPAGVDGVEGIYELWAAVSARYP